MADDRGGPDIDDRSALVESLSNAVESLRTVDPDGEYDDLDVIGEAIGDADVIGMGEASHGTREFFAFKRRLFRYLVEERGFRLFGLEANFAATLDVNDYVVWGEGTAEDGLSQEGIHESYRNESILELVEWIRAFNEDRSPDDRIRFHGFDAQYAPVAATRLKGFFETVDPDVLDGVRSELDRLAGSAFADFSDDEALRTHLEARTAVVSSLGDAMDEHERAYVEHTSWTEYERAKRLVWTIEQGRKQFEAIYEGRTDTDANVRIRDSAMAAQVQWLLRHEPADRIALWGHNAHLTRGAFGGGTVRHRQGIPSLGRNLATLRGIDYYALGLILGGGTVSATYVPERELRAYEIEDPPEWSVPAVFGRVDDIPFFLDVTAVPADSALGEWLDSRPLQYDVVGGYRDTPVNLVESDFGSQFDGVVFVDETTPSRAIAPKN